MPSSKSYRELHDRVAGRPGAAERLAALRRDTLAEIGRDKSADRRALPTSPRARTPKK